MPLRNKKKDKKIKTWNKYGKYTKKSIRISLAKANNKTNKIKTKKSNKQIVKVKPFVY